MIPFEHKTRVRFRDADPAGIAFSRSQRKPVELPDSVRNALLKEATP